MARNKNHECLNCHKKFENGWTAAKYCSAACKQQAYRDRKATVTQKSQSGRCIRCGRAAQKGQSYCGSVCKQMTNREKHSATFKLYQAVKGLDSWHAWQDCDGHWKDIYKWAESLGLVYNASIKCWHNPADQLTLPLEISA